MDLFVRESGPVGAPAIVFLHGGRLSGWSWDPVVERMRQRYHCLVPDLPQYGKSFQQGPFEMSRAADAVAEMILSRAGTGRAHVVGFSLGAQVGIPGLTLQQFLTLLPRAVQDAALTNLVNQQITPLGYSPVGLQDSGLNVQLLQGDLAEAWSEGGVDYATVAMRFSFVGALFERKTGRVLEGDPVAPQQSTELWTFRRERGRAWVLSAIQQTA
jgi:pimeloyl-ACP methyl ester carboxylesterase